MKIRALIIDDEPLARERIRLFLREEPDLEVVAECASGAEALAQWQRTQPDLLFLDVQMPELDGFEVLQQIPADRLPAVIFTTAFDRHAVRAFDAHAVDYLLKPFKPARFKEAVQRAREQIQQRQLGGAAQGLMALLAERTSERTVTRLSIKDGDKVSFVAVNDIDSIESAGNYVVLHVGKGQHILRETLTNLEARLPGNQFFRISRAAIVNLDRVKELQPMFKGESVVVLMDGRTLPTTRSLREIQEQMERR